MASVRPARRPRPAGPSPLPHAPGAWPVSPQGKAASQPQRQWTHRTEAEVLLRGAARSGRPQTARSHRSLASRTGELNRTGMAALLAEIKTMRDTKVQGLPYSAHRWRARRRSRRRRWRWRRRRAQRQACLGDTHTCWRSNCRLPRASSWRAAGTEIRVGSSPAAEKRRAGPHLQWQWRPLAHCVPGNDPPIEPPPLVPFIASAGAGHTSSSHCSMSSRAGCAARAGQSMAVLFTCSTRSTCTHSTCSTRATHWHSQHSQQQHPQPQPPVAAANSRSTPCSKFAAHPGRSSQPPRLQQAASSSNEPIGLGDWFDLE